MKTPNVADVANVNHKPLHLIKICFFSFHCMKVSVKNKINTNKILNLK